MRLDSRRAGRGSRCGWATTSGGWTTPTPATCPRRRCRRRRRRRRPRASGPAGFTTRARAGIVREGGLEGGGGRPPGPAEGARPLRVAQQPVVAVLLRRPGQELRRRKASSGARGRGPRPAEGVRGGGVPGQEQVGYRRPGRGFRIGAAGLGAVGRGGLVAAPAMGVLPPAHLVVGGDRLGWPRGTGRMNGRGSAGVSKLSTLDPWVLGGVGDLDRFWRRSAKRWGLSGLRG